MGWGWDMIEVLIDGCMHGFMDAWMVKRMDGGREGRENSRWVDKETDR